MLFVSTLVARSDTGFLSREIPMLTRNQRQNGIQRHRLLVLIENLHRPFHHASRFLFGIALKFHRFAFAG